MTSTDAAAYHREAVRQYRAHCPHSAFWLRYACPMKNIAGVAVDTTVRARILRHLPRYQRRLGALLRACLWQPETMYTVRSRVNDALLALLTHEATVAWARRVYGTHDNAIVCVCVRRDGVVDLEESYLIPEARHDIPTLSVSNFDD